jgi:hypothetical protein
MDQSAFNWIDSPNGWLIIIIGILFGFLTGLMYIQTKHNDIISEINRMTQSPLFPSPRSSHQ